MISFFCRYKLGAKFIFFENLNCLRESNLFPHYRLYINTKFHNIFKTNINQWDKVESSSNLEENLDSTHLISITLAVIFQESAYLIPYLPKFIIIQLNLAIIKLLRFILVEFRLVHAGAWKNLTLLKGASIFFLIIICLMNEAHIVFCIPDQLPWVDSLVSL